MAACSSLAPFMEAVLFWLTLPNVGPQGSSSMNLYSRLLAPPPYAEMMIGCAMVELLLAFIEVFLPTTAVGTSAASFAAALGSDGPAMMPILKGTRGVTFCAFIGAIANKHKINRASRARIVLRCSNLLHLLFSAR